MSDFKGVLARAMYVADVDHDAWDDEQPHLRDAYLGKAVEVMHGLVVADFVIMTRAELDAFAKKAEEAALRPVEEAPRESRSRTRRRRTGDEETEDGE